MTVDSRCDLKEFRTHALLYINLACIAAYFSEIVGKLIAYGFSSYIRRYLMSPDQTGAHSLAAQKRLPGRLSYDASKPAVPSF